MVKISTPQNKTGTEAQRWQDYYDRCIDVKLNPTREQLKLIKSK